MPMKKVVSLSMEKVYPPDDADRTNIDPLKVIELAESIREVGLQDPIQVRPVNGRYEIVYGHRRYLAHKHLGLDKIDCFVKDLSDGDVLLLRAIENLQRENLSPLDEARVYYRMKTKLGMSTKEIVRRTGKHGNTVTRYLRLCEYPVEFQQGVDKKLISFEVAEKLMEIDDPQMRTYFVNMAVENGITERVAEMWVSDYRRSKEGNFSEESVGQGGLNLQVQERPVFIGCECCLGPVDIHKARSISVCPECFNSVRGSRVVKVSA